VSPKLTTLTQFSTPGGIPATFLRSPTVAHVILSRGIFVAATTQPSLAVGRSRIELI